MLSVCSIGKYCLYIKMAKLSSKKQEKSSFYKEKSLVGLTPGSVPVPVPANISVSVDH